jgi:hypothetical protein
MTYIEIIYGLWCVLFAYINAQWIKDGKRIQHGWNGALHLLIAGIAFVLFGWAAGLILLLNTRVIFDTTLNYFRGLPLGYVSLKPKSIIDKLEKFVFGTDGITPKIIYVVISVVLHIIKPH